jgi:DNA repair photolyase
VYESRLVLNTRQGCPKGCTYCALKDHLLTRVRPAELARRTADPYWTSRFNGSSTMVTAD